MTFVPPMVDPRTTARSGPATLAEALPSVPDVWVPPVVAPPTSWTRMVPNLIRPEPRWLIRSGMAVIVAVFAVFVLRSLRLDGSPILVMVTAASPFLLLAAVPAAGYALATRRWILFLMMSLIAAANLLGIASERGAGVQESTGGPELTIATANIEESNERAGDLLISLAAADPQIIFLQEVTPELLELLESSPVWDDFDHRVLDPRPGFHGSAILSKVPLDGGGVVWVDGWPMTAATITLPALGRNEPVLASLVNVHVRAPLEETGRWARQMAELGRFSREHGQAVIFAGDFNSTKQHAPLQELLGADLQDAHLVSGTGFGTTWPAESLVPRLIRLDRVFANEHFAPLQTDTVQAVGSNHRAIITRLEIVEPPEVQ